MICSLYFSPLPLPVPLPLCLKDPQDMPRPLCLSEPLLSILKGSQILSSPYPCICFEFQRDLSQFLKYVLLVWGKDKRTKPRARPQQYPLNPSGILEGQGQGQVQMQGLKNIIRNPLWLKARAEHIPRSLQETAKNLWRLKIRMRPDSIRVNCDEYGI